jgi:hypothetical protein
MDEMKLQPVNQMTPATSATPATTTSIKPGLRTTEFWITLAVLVVNHITAALRASASPSAMVAAAVVDAVATSSYAIARTIAKMRGAAAVLLLLLLTPTSCATFNGAAKACEDQLTPALKQIAGAALEGQDYEEAIVRELGALTPCLRRAAVSAATEWAKHAKASGTVDTGAIARHGDAWMRAHDKDPLPAPSSVSAISPALAESRYRTSAARAGRARRLGANRQPGRPPSHGPAWMAGRRAGPRSRRPSRRSHSGRKRAASVLEVT